MYSNCLGLSQALVNLKAALWEYKTYKNSFIALRTVSLFHEACKEAKSYMYMYYAAMKHLPENSKKLNKINLENTCSCFLNFPSSQISIIVNL